MEPLYNKFCNMEKDEQGNVRDFSLKFPDSFNFAYEVVDQIAKEEPNKIALVWCDPTGREETFTFGQLSSLSGKAAAFLQAHGVRKGDKVMLILKRHFEYWYTLLALHKLGAVAIPSTHMLRQKDIVYRVQNAQISAVVCAEDESILSAVEAARQECEELQHLFVVRTQREGFLRLDTGLEECEELPQRVQTMYTDPFLMYFTSGTTDYPKAVIHDYTYPLAHIPTAKLWQACEDGGLHLTVSDTGWGKASWGKIYGQWLCGCAVMVYDYEHFNASQLLAVIRKYGVTTFCAPPTVYRFMVKNGFTKEDFASVKHVTTAGEALNPDIIRKFEQITGLLIHEGYGQTETTLLLANLAGAPVRIGAIGKPSPQYDIRLVDEDGREVGTDCDGEIVIVPKPNQHGICSGYLNAEQNALRAWKNGVFHTGDVGRRDADGYFWYIGRKDDIIKSSGYRIGPFEIEDVLIAHDAVLECAVTGVPDEERGCVVKATIVLRTGYTPSEALKKELQNFVKEKTAPYKYPRVVEFVDELPKTISGKIRRAQIRKESAENK